MIHDNQNIYIYFYIDHDIFHVYTSKEDRCSPLNHLSWALLSKASCKEVLKLVRTDTIALISFSMAVLMLGDLKYKEISWQEFFGYPCLLVEPSGQEPIDCFLSFALRIRELMSLIALQCVVR